MAREFAKKFYKSKAWRECREAFYISKHGICERCGEAGKIVHHTIYLNPQNINDPNISLNFDHLELLCATCHQHEHYKAEATREDVRFDSEGNLIQK